MTITAAVAQLRPTLSCPATLMITEVLAVRAADKCTYTCRDVQPMGSLDVSELRPLLFHRTQARVPHPDGSLGVRKCPIATRQHVIPDLRGMPAT